MFNKNQEWTLDAQFTHSVADWSMLIINKSRCESHFQTEILKNLEKVYTIPGRHFIPNRVLE